MSAQRHYFRLRARYGPRDLFLALKRACGDVRFRGYKPEFDFDWMKRRIEIIADTEAAAGSVLEEFHRLVASQVHENVLVAGKPKPLHDGRVMIPLGVLLQEPTVYTEQMVDMLAELGIAGIQYEYEDEGISIPAVAGRFSPGYRDAISAFPLPGYVELIDEGTH